MASFDTAALGSEERFHKRPGLLIKEKDYVRSIFIARASSRSNRRQRNPSLPRQRTGSGACRIAQTHKRDKVARTGNGHGCIARRPARDDSGTRALLGDRLRLAQDRGETERTAAIHYRDRWA